MSATVSDMKPALMTIWSSQVAQAERLIKNCRMHEARKAAMIQVVDLSRSIRDIIDGSYESWELGESTRIADVLTHDVRKLQGILASMEGK